MIVKRLARSYTRLKEVVKISKKFYAVNRFTGERWKPNNKPGGPYDSVRQYLVLYDSGYCAVVSEEFYTSVEPLDPKVWEVVKK